MYTDVKDSIQVSGGSVGLMYADVRDSAHVCQVALRAHVCRCYGQYTGVSGGFEGLMHADV